LVPHTTDQGPHRSPNHHFFLLVLTRDDVLWLVHTALPIQRRPYQFRLSGLVVREHSDICTKTHAIGCERSRSTRARAQKNTTHQVDISLLSRRFCSTVARFERQLYLTARETHKSESLAWMGSRLLWRCGQAERRLGHGCAFVPLAAASSCFLQRRPGATPEELAMSCRPECAARKVPAQCPRAHR